MAEIDSWNGYNLEDLVEFLSILNLQISPVTITEDDEHLIDTNMKGFYLQMFLSKHMNECDVCKLNGRLGFFSTNRNKLRIYHN